MSVYETWCGDVSSYLQELCFILDGFLDVLRVKLRNENPTETESPDPSEQALLARLETNQQQRQELLTAAGRVGLPNDSLQSAVAALPDENGRNRLNALLLQTVARRQQLHHASVVNWVLTQRSLVHVDQLLEILATGEPQPPTYGKGDGAPRGGLLDSAA